VTLLDITEPNDGTSTGIGLLVTVRDTHTSSYRDVEASKLTLLVGDGNKPDIIGIDINIIDWWDCNSDFELQTTYLINN
jgi:hypothetical protein